MPRTRRPTARWNLVLIGFLVTLFGGIAFGMRFMNQAPVLILPELQNLPPIPREENAYFDLAQAASLLPRRMLPLLQVPDPKDPKRKVFYEAQEGSLAHLMKIDRSG